LRLFEEANILRLRVGRRRGRGKKRSVEIVELLGKRRKGKDLERTWISSFRERVGGLRGGGKKTA